MKNTIKIIVYVLATISITSCAIANKTYLPDGTLGHSISCDGSAVGMNVCFEKAGEICGTKGYKLLNREGQVIYSGVYLREQGVSQFGAFNSKSILIKCN
jgi:hypothetical protein